MAFRIVRQVTFRGELRERTVDHAGDVLHIGRGTSNELHLDDLAVSLIHAQITRDSQGRYVLKDLTGTGATYVNQAPVMEAFLRSGDTIRIQRYRVAMSQPDPAGPLVLTVEEQALDKDEPSLALLPKLQLSTGRWTKRALALMLTGLVTVGSVLALGVGQHGIFMPGAVSLKHAKFAQQCDKCHESWKAVWTVVPNKTCQTCHPATLLTPSHFGDRALGPAPQCASCHLEHKGETFLAAVPDGQCVQCHGALEAKNPTIPVVTSVHSFTRDHPEFAISRRLPDQPAPTRVRLDDRTLLKDEGRLKLNHEVHLAPDLPTPAGRETLTCASCHRTDTEGRYMQPIIYERDCMRCHTLEFDSQLPGKTVTHGRQPVDVRRELEEIYSAVFLRAFPEEAKRLSGVRRLPGQPPTRQELFVDERRAKAERILFPPVGKRCLKCHEADADAPSEERRPKGDKSDRSAQREPTQAGKETPETAIPRARGLPGRAREATKEIGKSDYLLVPELDNQDRKTLSGAGLFRIRTVNVPERWFPYSRFDHAAHFGLAEIKKKGNVCLACHDAAATSRKTDDVLVPPIGTCRTCHVEPGGAQAGCRACHDFHPKQQADPKRSAERVMPPARGLVGARIESFP